MADLDPGASESPDDEADWTNAQRATLMRVVTFGALYLTNGSVDLGIAFYAKVSLINGLEAPYQTVAQQRRALANVPPAAI